MIYQESFESGTTGTTLDESCCNAKDVEGGEQNIDLNITRIHSYNLQSPPDECSDTEKQDDLQEQNLDLRRIHSYNLQPAGKLPEQEEAETKSSNLFLVGTKKHMYLQRTGSDLSQNRRASVDGVASDLPDVDQPRVEMMLKIIDSEKRHGDSKV